MSVPTLPTFSIDAFLMSDDAGASPLLTQTELNLDESQIITVNVLLVDGKSKQIDLDKDGTVQDIVNAIDSDETIAKPEPHTSVVIFRGRILKHTEPLKSLGSDEFPVHLVFHANTPEPQNSGLEGFDRLKDLGYDEAEVMRLREIFHEIQGTVNAPDAERIAIEEEWVPVILNSRTPLEILGERPTQTQQNQERCPDLRVLVQIFCYSVIGFVFGVVGGPVVLLISFLMLRSNRTLTYATLFGAILRVLLKGFDESLVLRRLLWG